MLTPRDLENASLAGTETVTSYLNMNPATIDEEHHVHFL
jgi:hypothetical protein